MSSSAVFPLELMEAPIVRFAVTLLIRKTDLSLKSFLMSGVAELLNKTGTPRAVRMSISCFNVSWSAEENPEV